MDDREIFRKLANCQDKEQMTRVIEEYNKQQKPMTNADRIRAMSDEELVKYFWDIGVWDSFEDGKFCDGNCNAENNCDLCRLRWLQQPAEGECP